MEKVKINKSGNFTNYEEELKKNIERNKKYIDGFSKWLIDKNLAARTIRKHISNIDIYIIDYLNYY